MNTLTRTAAVSLTAAALSACASDYGVVAKPQPAPNHCETCTAHNIAGPQGLDWFKLLATGKGLWEATAPGPDGKPMTARLHFKSVAGGTAVCETLFPGQPHEMITMYHLDKGTLTATHYCSLGNQPRMSARVCACDPAARTAAFTFRDATNMNPAKDPCMGMQEYTLKGPDTLTVQWHHLGPGGIEDKSQSMPAITFTRVN